ncbi:hypothetical protein BU26DRAFT_609109 [Trematosphaeria pertusa]|uniref:Uncharacterized protein n=1 Tax=Trematosphaeria pertusa TaxID=390896 RepID=A0A6A6I0E2_9PLEO|nr:uncharacterized protein BU26DRAFT_609109 [Trematosphaeria pertusa]KAF2243781.1 hypothetical protein BU26DRAFT_609109 [Trematosphaeria pertusa]
MSCNPDDLIHPFRCPERLFGDFNDMPRYQEPLRDVPSILLAHISRPDVYAAEPDWTSLMGYFLSKGRQGYGNLQDLYVFITRFVLPLTIIDNRKMVLDMYLARRDLPSNIRLRYDAWNINDHVRPDMEPVSFPALDIPVRSVVPSDPTPNGTDFLQWLNMPPNTPLSVPVQLQHRRSQLDLYLNEHESVIRRIVPGALLLRTARVLHLFWWLAGNNARLRYYQQQDWVGVETEIYA